MIVPLCLLSTSAHMHTDTHTEVLDVPLVSLAADHKGTGNWPAKAKSRRTRTAVVSVAMARPWTESTFPKSAMREREEKWKRARMREKPPIRRPWLSQQRAHNSWFL